MLFFSVSNFTVCSNWGNSHAKPDMLPLESLKPIQTVLFFEPDSVWRLLSNFHTLFSSISHVAALYDILYTVFSYCFVFFVPLWSILPSTQVYVWNETLLISFCTVEVYQSSCQLYLTLKSSGKKFSTALNALTETPRPWHSPNLESKPNLEFFWHKLWFLKIFFLQQACWSDLFLAWLDIWAFQCSLFSWKLFWKRNWPLKVMIDKKWLLYVIVTNQLLNFTGRFKNPAGTVPSDTIEGWSGKKRLGLEMKIDFKMTANRWVLKLSGVSKRWCPHRARKHVPTSKGFQMTSCARSSLIVSENAASVTFKTASASAVEWTSSGIERAKKSTLLRSVSFFF